MCPFAAHADWEDKEASTKRTFFTIAPTESIKLFLSNFVRRRRITHRFLFLIFLSSFLCSFLSIRFHSFRFINSFLMVFGATCMLPFNSTKKKNKKKSMRWPIVHWIFSPHLPAVSSSFMLIAGGWPSQTKILKDYFLLVAWTWWFSEDEYRERCLNSHEFRNRIGGESLCGRPLVLGIGVISVNWFCMRIPHIFRMACTSHRLVERHFSSPVLPPAPMEPECMK